MKHQCLPWLCLSGSIPDHVDIVVAVAGYIYWTFSADQTDVLTSDAVRILEQ
jgi:hypothetical protein